MLCCAISERADGMEKMTRRIDYLIEKYHFTEINESPRIASQWKEVLAECQQENAGVEERLRIALLNVDYVTSFELPFRLLLTRTPQLIDKLRKEFALTQKNVLINDKRRGGFTASMPISVASPMPFAIVCRRVSAVWMRKPLPRRPISRLPVRQSIPRNGFAWHWRVVCRLTPGWTVLAGDPAYCRRYSATPRVRHADSGVRCRGVRFTDRHAPNRDGIPSLTGCQFLKAG